MSLAVFGGYLVVHAMYGDWTGGGGWGPRYLMTVIPFVLLPAGEVLQVAERRRLARLALVAIVTVSLLVQILGISVTWARHAQRVLDSSATPRIYYWRSTFCWADAPILGQVRSLLEVLALVRDPASRTDMAALVGPESVTPTCTERRPEPVEGPSRSTRDWQSEAVGLLSFNVPDFWFVYLWFLGTPVGWLAAVVFVLSGVAAGAALQLLWRLRGEAK